MKDNPSILAAMTPFPYTVDGTENLEQAKRMMYEHDIRHLPVTKDGSLYGIITDRDIKLAVAVKQEPDSGTELTVAEVCLTEPFIAQSSELLAEVVVRMAERHIGSALVEKEGRLVGIFTSTDACRVLGEMLSGSKLTEPPDQIA